MPAGRIFTKEYVSTSAEQVEKFKKEFNIHCRACIGWLVYLLYTRLDLSFAVNKLAEFSADPGKENFEGLVHLLRSIRYNKTLWLKYYADMNDSPITDLLRQAIIKTDNHLMGFSDSFWQDCPDTGRIAGAYIIFYQGGPNDHGKHVTGPVFQSSAENE